MQTSVVTPRPDHVHEVRAGESFSLYLLDLPLPLSGFDPHLSSWLVRDTANGRDIIIDTGPSASAPVLQRSLQSLGVKKLDLILLTHIHADHAGGVGHLLSLYPEARVLAPEKGRRHLVSPAKLAEGTRATLGEEMADAFGPIYPVPEENLTGPDSPLLEGVSVLDTPGHASHHSSYVFSSPFGKVLFPGEAAGVGLGEAVRHLWLENPESVSSGPYLFPATPPRLDGAALERSMELLAPHADARLLCFSHYGWTENVAETLRMARNQFRFWTEKARRCIAESEDESVALLREELLREDPLLSLLPRLRPEQRSKEIFFIENSLRGIVRWVRS